MGKEASTQNIPVSGSTQITEFTMVSPLGPCGFFIRSSTFNPTSGTYIIPVDGYYLVGAIISASTTAEIVEGRINITTPTSTLSIIDGQQLSGGGFFVTTPSRIVQLNKGNSMSLSIHTNPVSTGVIQECWWGVFLRQKTGFGSLTNSFGVRPVSKVLTDYNRDSIGFAAQFPSTVVQLSNGTPETLSKWSVSGKGMWNSGQFNPEDGCFTVPEDGFYHISYSVTAEFGPPNIEVTTQITATDSCILLPLTIGGANITDPLVFVSPNVLVLLRQGDVLNVQMTALPSAIYNAVTTASWSMNLHQEGI